MVRCCIEGCDREARFACFSPTGDGRLIGYYCEEHGLAMMEEGYGRICRWFEIAKRERCRKTLKEVVEEEGGMVSLERASYLLNKPEKHILSMAESEGVKIVKRLIPRLNVYVTFLALEGQDEGKQLQKHKCYRG